MKCHICERRCEITEGGTGACRMYTSEKGIVKEKFPGTWLTMFPVSAETIPLLHFHPRKKFLQLSTAGCNFTCRGCISEVIARNSETLSHALKARSPESILGLAEKEGCAGIAFCINDPTVSFHTFTELAAMAHKKGLLAGCSTNCYFTEESLEELIPCIDFVNIGLKGITDESYRECGASSAEPVFRNMKRLHEAGIHVEVSAMYKRGMEDDLHKIAERLNSISPHIPLQVMRFIPLGEASIEDEPSIQETEVLCDSLRRILSRVYLFNSPGTSYLNTLCPECGKVMLEREFFGPMGARTLCFQSHEKCSCGAHMPVKGSINQSAFREPGFFGGYRTTRAMEMLQSILSCLKAPDSSTAQLWAEVMDMKYLDRLHHTIQVPEKYCDTVSFLAERTDTVNAGQELSAYLNGVIEDVKNRVRGREKPPVYYAMGYPLFAINAERFESNLAEIAGGECINKSIEREGKPGVTVSPDEFNAFNPEYIFISGFLSCPVEDFTRYCRDKGLRAEAIEKKQIYQLPPSWDFGNPRWALGLMFIANILHPDVCSYDLEAEAENFYTRFYGTSYSDSRVSRSFYNVK